METTDDDSSHSMPVKDKHAPAQAPPTYLISSVKAHTAKNLPHERLHALYYLGTEYRQQCNQIWDDLPPKERKVVEYDLHMRGYAEHVWPDEFQAYISEDVKEFGQRVVSTVAEARQDILKAQKLAWDRMTK